MRNTSWERHRVAVLSMGISVLLHLLLFSWSYLQPPKLEKRVFRVQRVSPMRVLRPRAFRVPNFKPAVPGEMEMLRRGGGPAYIPEIALPPAAALGDVRDEIERMLMPEADMLSFLQPGAKPAEFRMERAEMIPTEEFGVPKPSPRFDLAFDLLRLEDLEKTGLKSFVIVDPEDRRNIAGYFHVTRTRGMGGMDLTQLAENMSRRTGLRVQAEDHWVRLRSPEIFKAPLLFLGSPGRIEYDESGRRREPLGVGVDTLKFVEGVEKQDIEFLAEYLLKGGFLVLPQMELYDQLQRHLQEAHPQRFAFFSLPVEHELFHSYYDIDPESLNELFRSINLRDEAAARRLPSWFQGIGLEGRLVAIAPIRVPRWVPPLDTGGGLPPGGFPAHTPGLHTYDQVLHQRHSLCADPAWRHRVHRFQGAQARTLLRRGAGRLSGHPEKPEHGELGSCLDEGLSER